MMQQNDAGAEAAVRLAVGVFDLQNGSIKYDEARARIQPPTSETHVVELPRRPASVNGSLPNLFSGQPFLVSAADQYAGGDVFLGLDRERWATAQARQRAHSPAESLGRVPLRDSWEDSSAAGAVFGGAADCYTWTISKSCQQRARHGDNLLYSS